MKHTPDTNEFTAAEMRLALSDIYPDSTYGAVPVIDQYDALEAFRAFDDGALTEAPHAFAAYVDYQQRQWA